MREYLTPFYDKLCRDKTTLGVSNRFVSLEAVCIGFALFVIHAYWIIAFMLAIHLTIAILNAREREWLEITKLLMKLPGEEHAILP